MSFPTTPIIDTFSGGLSNWSDNIEPFCPTMTIISGELGPTAPFQSNYWSSVMPEAQEAFVTVSALPGFGAWMQLCARIQNTNQADHQRYQVTVYYDGAWNIERTIGGVGVSTLQILGGAGSVIAGNKIGLSVVGSTLKAYLYSGGSWAQVGTNVTNLEIAGSGYIGLFGGNSTDIRFDDFGGGGIFDANAAPPPTARMRARRTSW